MLIPSTEKGSGRRTQGLSSADSVDDEDPPQTAESLPQQQAHVDQDYGSPVGDSELPNEERREVSAPTRESQFGRMHKPDLQNHVSSQNLVKYVH